MKVAMVLQTNAPVPFTQLDNYYTTKPKGYTTDFSADQSFCCKALATAVLERPSQAFAFMHDMAARRVLETLRVCNKLSAKANK